MEVVSSLFIPGLIILVVLAFFFVMWAASKRYKRIPPGKIGIFFGRKYNVPDPSNPGTKIMRGFHVMSSGGKILMPLVEDYRELSTNVFQIDIDEERIPNKDNVPMNISGIATCRIGGSLEEQMNAAESFLGKSDEDMKSTIRNILLGHLRAIIGNMNIDELLRKRDEFNRRVIGESMEEFKNLGINVNLVIQDVNDAEGYIESLGKKAVAEVKRDAEITVSNADKEAKIVMANNEAEVAEKEKDRDIKKAQYKVLADTENAKAEKAKEIALVSQDMIVKVKTAERDEAEKKAQINVQRTEAIRVKEELIANVIEPAEAEKNRLKIEAEGKQMKETIDAKTQADVKKTIALGDADAMKTNAEAEKEKMTKEGEGEANKIKSKLEAEAGGIKAKLLAEAEGDAEKVKLKLLGEAQGTKEMAEALKEMNEAARLILILDRLPSFLKVLGESGSMIAESIFKNAAAPLGNIDSINIVDVGGNGNGINKISSIVPETIVKVCATLKGLGIDPTKLIEQFKLNPESFMNMLSGNSPKSGSSGLNAGDIEVSETKKTHEVEVDNSDHKEDKKSK